LEQAEQSMKLAVNLAMKRLRRLSPCAAASDRSMPADILIALLGFAFATSIKPGPNNILVMASSLNHSVARTIPVILGISAGFAFMLLAVGIGLGAAIRVNASLNTATKAFGFAYTLWLAWKVATSAPTLEVSARAAKPESAFTVAMFRWVNPYAWDFAFSAAGAYTETDAPYVSLAWIASIFLVVAISSLSVWAAFGSFILGLIDSLARCASSTSRWRCCLSREHRRSHSRSRRTYHPFLSDASSAGT
jgi:threonine/homoserine/homoserine lactone efflux protein